MAPSNLQKRLACKIVERGRVWDLPAGTHLREEDLTRAFGVSRTPVRSALQALASHGVLQHRPNQGYFLAVPGSELPDELADDLAPEEEQLVRRVIRDRLAGRLDDRVSESGLQRRYACSRTTARRLTDYMEREGLLERRGGQGWRFLSALNSQEAYSASFRFRLLIEPAVFREPTFLPDPEALERLRQKHRKLVDGDVDRVSSAHIYEVDAAFHETLAQWSGNPFLLDNVRQQIRLRRLTDYEFYAADAELFRESCRQHLAIITALTDRDVAGAGQRMADHIRWSWSHSPTFG